MGRNHSSGPVEALSVLQACLLSRGEPAGFAADEPAVSAADEPALSVRLIFNETRLRNEKEEREAFPFENIWRWPDPSHMGPKAE